MTFQSYSRETAGALATIITNTNGPATKIFSIKDGKLDKKSAAQVYEGETERREIADIDDLLALIDSLESNQALTYGWPEVERAKLVTQKRLNGPGTIARDRAHFNYHPDWPGIFFNDHDPKDGSAPLEPEELDRIVCSVMPEWGDTDRVWRPSASGFLILPDGIQYPKKGGLHAYTLVADASLIPAIGKELYRRLWLAGYGYIFVNKAGAVYDRSIIDASVWQPERLDFAAPPILRNGLERREIENVIFRGKHRFFDPAGIGTADEARFKKMLDAAKKAAKPEWEPKQKAWAEKQSKAAEKRGIKVDKKVFINAVRHQKLGADFIIQLADDRKITLGEMMADPDRWHEARFPDPIEPDYAGGDKRIAVAYLKQPNPCIVSHAHGKVRYAIACEANGGAGTARIGDAAAPLFSNEDIALRFAARHKDSLRYVDAWGKWYEFTGAHWREDSTLFAFDLARKLCRETAAESGDSKTQKELTGAGTVAATERLARSDRKLAATVEQWDADPWLLNTPSGTVDLRTGS